MGRQFIVKYGLGYPSTKLEAYATEAAEIAERLHRGESVSINGREFDVVVVVEDVENEQP